MSQSAYNFIKNILGLVNPSLVVRSGLTCNLRFPLYNALHSMRIRGYSTRGSKENLALTEKKSNDPQPSPSINDFFYTHCNKVDSDLAQARSELEQARSELEQAQSELAQAQMNHNLFYKKNPISPYETYYARPPRYLTSHRSYIGHELCEGCVSCGSVCKKYPEPEKKEYSLITTLFLATFPILCLHYFLERKKDEQTHIFVKEMNAMGDRMRQARLDVKKSSEK
jgi:DNA-binding transcriptional MerR regulator